MKQLYVDRIFSDNMVLQREQEIEIWGTCTTYSQVTVKLEKHSVQAKVEDASWSVRFPPMKATKSATMIISAGDEDIEIRNIAIGDVWLAGGQSNMEFFMRYDEDYKSEAEQCENADIRFYDVPELCYAGQEEEFDYSRMGYWRTCDKENLEYYSAVASKEEKTCW